MRLFHFIIFFLVIGTGLSMYLSPGEIRVVTPESLSSSDSQSSYPLQADFSGFPASGRAPLMVRFFDLTKGYPVAWNWDFGDGSTSSAENPLHTYEPGGEYTVRLTVYDQSGGSDTRVKEHYITAHPVPLHANFTAEPLSGPAPLSVQFTDGSVGARIWLWNFGDGSQESMIPDPSHTFTNPGTYPVILRVSNEKGETEKYEQIINVTSSKEVIAGFTASPRSGPLPLTVQFTDQSTGDITSWLWNFGDGTRDNTKNPVHTYVKSGVYEVALSVEWVGHGSDTVKKADLISVTDIPISSSIPLSSGWNFISVPRVLAPGKDTAEIFHHVDTAGHSAFQYSPAAGGWVSLGSSDPVLPLEAYWIYSAKNDEVPLSYNPVFGQNPSKVLVKGWNSVGFSLITPVEAKIALTSVKDTWQNCIGFNPVIQRYDEMIFKGFNDNTTVHPGAGYWVYMSGEGILTNLL